MRFLPLLLLLSLHLACQSNRSTAPQKQTEDDTITYLALGDSYTIGTALEIFDPYPARLSKRLEQEPGISRTETRLIAENGWTTADLRQGISEAQPDSTYDLVSLLIGVNNQYQGRSLKEYRQQFTALLQYAIILADNKKENVFVLSIPDWGATPSGAGKQLQISAEIDQFNQVNKSITDSLSVKYFNITDISRKAVNKPELVADDDLHFSAKMHKIWVDAIYEEVLEMVRE